MRCMYNISNISAWRLLYSWTTDSSLLFVDLIYIVLESMSATVTSSNVVVVLHGRNTSSQQLYNFPSVLWEGTTASSFKALDFFLSFFSFYRFFFH